MNSGLSCFLEEKKCGIECMWCLLNRVKKPQQLRSEGNTDILNLIMYRNLLQLVRFKVEILCYKCHRHHVSPKVKLFLLSVLVLPPHHLHLYWRLIFSLLSVDICSVVWRGGGEARRISLLDLHSVYCGDKHFSLNFMFCSATESLLSSPLIHPCF